MGTASVCNCGDDPSTLCYDCYDTDPPQKHDRTRSSSSSSSSDHDLFPLKSNVQQETHGNEEEEELESDAVHPESIKAKKRMKRKAKKKNDTMDWNDDHSSTDYKLKWKQYEIQTNFHRYSPNIAKQSATGSILNYKSPPPDSNGGNFWLPSNVQIINNELHLAMYNNPNLAPIWNNNGTIVPIWCCAEAVVTNKPLNKYGTISVDIKSYGNTLDANNMATDWSSFSDNINVVLGIFTFDKNGGGTQKNPYREIDLFESISSYKSQFNKGNAQFTMQKAEENPKENIYRMDVEYATLKVLNVNIDWKESEIVYTASNKDTGSIIASWTYNDSDYIPTPSDTMFLHLNLWVYGGPGDNKLRHIAISNVTFS